MEDTETSRRIPEWMLKQLCSTRLAVYKSEMRGLSNPNPNTSSGSGPFEVDDRPYGIPWHEQGAAKDIWWLIFEKVTEPKDIINLSEVSDLFRHILRRKYIQARLPEILDLILSRNLDIGRQEPIWDPNVVHEDEDEALIIPTSDIDRLKMKLRLLSKTTKKAIEDFKVPRPEFRRWHPGMEIPTLFLRRRIKIENLVREMDQIQNFRNDGNFYPHTIYVDDIPLPDGVNSETIILPVLQRIGKSVKRLRYESLTPTGFEGLYSCLVAWTTETPNLEELEVICVLGDLEGLDDELQDPRPFPTIPTLRKYKDDTDMPKNFRARILEANPTIKSVLLGSTTANRIFLPNEVLGNLKLEELRLRCAPPKSLIQYPFHWPLRKLEIDDYFGRDGTFQSLELFGFLNRFKTLENLHVYLVVEDTGGILELPNVRTFRWKLHRSLENMDFIIPLEKLEHLHLAVEDGRWRTKNPYYFPPEEIQKDREETLEIFKGLRNENFQDTNIKVIFPRLKSLRVRYDLKSFRL